MTAKRHPPWSGAREIFWFLVTALGIWGFLIVVAMVVVEAAPEPRKERPQPAVVGLVDGLDTVGRAGKRGR